MRKLVGLTARQVEKQEDKQTKERQTKAYRDRGEAGRRGRGLRR